MQEIEEQLCKLDSDKCVVEVCFFFLPQSLGVNATAVIFKAALCDAERHQIDVCVRARSSTGPGV